MANVKKSVSRTMRSVLLCAFALAAAAPRAEALLDVGLSGVWKAQTTMAANPPLPMLRNRAGSWQVTLQPAWYSGSPGLNSTDAQLYSSGGSFKGAGGGGCLSYAFTDRWGAYVWALGSTSKGDATVTPQSTCSNCSSFSFPSVQASYQLLSAGAVWQAIGGKEGEFSMPVFAGAIVSHTSSLQTVRSTFSGSLLDDYDMRIEDTTPGFGIGVQAGIPMGKKWELNPFVLGAVFAGDGCANYIVTRQGADNGLSRVSSKSCSGFRQLHVGEDPLGLALGINLAYQPWHLSVNITAPFLVDIISKEIYSEHATVRLLTFSWHYGR